MNKTIMLIEDNDYVRTINREALVKSGYLVQAVETLAEARALVLQKAPDLIVLDVLLPDGSGLTFCEELRKTMVVPILFLSALGDCGDIIRGLRAGGDDYMVKPYDLNVLLMKIEAMLRREQFVAQQVRDNMLEEEAPNGLIVRGPLTLDISTMTASISGREVHLTPREFALLLALARQEGQHVSNRALSRVAWGMDAVDDEHAVRVQISRLRSKLLATGSGLRIQAERGRGYALMNWARSDTARPT